MIGLSWLGVDLRDKFVLTGWNKLNANWPGSLNSIVFFVNRSSVEDSLRANIGI